MCAISASPRSVTQIVPWGDPESLANLQRQMDVDILITGHTHKNEVRRLRLDYESRSALSQQVYEYERKYIINPGSLTGAYSAHTTCVARKTATLGALNELLLV
jgi:vacuolar protein sorting-associated protein 29